MLVVGPVADLDVTILQVLQGGNRELTTLRDNLCTSIVLHTLRSLTLCKGYQFLDQDILQVLYLCLMLLINLSKQNLILLLGSTGLGSTRKELLIDNNTRQRRIGLQRRILHITSLIAKDSTEQLLFWRRIALTLRRNLTDQDIAWLHTGTHTDDTILVKVLSSLFADVRNISSKLLGTTLSLTYIQ